MSTFTGDIGREEEDGGGWGGLLPDKTETTGGLMGPEDQHDLPIEREEYEIWARKEEVKALRRALVVIMDMIEKGVLVRNAAGDENFAQFVEQSVGLTLALKQAQDAINLGRTKPAAVTGGTLTVTE